jgi:uncharacterized Zn-finger protein
MPDLPSAVSRHSYFHLTEFDEPSSPSEVHVIIPIIRSVHSHNPSLRSIKLLSPNPRLYLVKWTPDQHSVCTYCSANFRYMFLYWTQNIREPELRHSIRERAVGKGKGATKTPCALSLLHPPRTSAGRQCVYL